MTPMTLRCLWRELRLSQSFWIAVFLLSIGLQALTRLLNAVWIRDAQGSALIMHLLTWLMPLVYLVGIAGSSFSRDDESGMAKTLRTLPLSWHPMWIAKILFASVSCVAMLLLLQLITWSIGIDHPYPIVAPAEFAFNWSSILLATLGVALLTSTLVRRPLVSTFLAGAMLFAIFGPWTYSRPWVNGRQSSNPVEPNYVLYLLIGVVTILVSAVTTRRWLTIDTHQPILAQLQHFLHRIATRTPMNSALTRESGVRWHDLAGRFAWVSLRSQGSIFLVLGLLSLPILSIMALVEPESLLVFIPVVGFAWPPMVGGTLYAPEQQTSHRQFLAERGVRGRQVWWLRTGLLTGILLLVASVASVIWLSQNAHIEPHQPRELAKLYTVYCLVTFAASQYLSLVITSPLIAATASFALAAVTASWCTFGLAYALPIYVQLTPMLGFLFGSWFRADAWLVQRNRGPNWILTLAAPFVGLIMISYPVLYWHRVLVPGFTPSTTERAAEWMVDLTSSQALPHDQKEALQQAADFAGALWPSADFDSLDAGWGDLQSERTIRRTFASNQNTDTEIVWRWPTVNGQRLPTLQAMETWLQDHEPQVLTPEVVAAVNAEGVIERSPDEWYYSTWPRRYAHLARLFVLRAVIATQHGDLHAADDDFRRGLLLLSKLRAEGGWDEWIWSQDIDGRLCEELLIWAAAPGQSVESIEKMAWHLSDFIARQPSPMLATQIDFTRRRQGAAGLPHSIENSPSHVDAESLYALTFMPGEITRLQRLVDVSYDQILRDLTNSTDTMPSEGGPLPSLATVDHARWTRPPYSNTTLFSQFFTPAYVSGALSMRIRLEERQRATVVRLFLIADRLRYGEYPARSALNELNVAGLKNDVSQYSPQTGRAFRYLQISPQSDHRLMLIPLVTGTALVDAQGALAVSSYDEAYLLPHDDPVVEPDKKPRLTPAP